MTKKYVSFVVSRTYEMWVDVPEGERLADMIIAGRVQTKTLHEEGKLIDAEIVEFEMLRSEDNGR